MFISIGAYVRFADHLAAQTVIKAQRSGIFLFGATIMSPLLFAGVEHASTITRLHRASTTRRLQ
jgi:hypothetical protein